MAVHVLYSFTRVRFSMTHKFTSANSALLQIFLYNRPWSFRLLPPELYIEIPTMNFKFALVFVAVLVSTIAEPADQCSPAVFIERLGFKCDETLVHPRSAKVAMFVARCRDPEKWLPEEECKLETLMDFITCQHTGDAHADLTLIHDEVLELCNLATEERKMEFAMNVVRLLRDFVKESVDKKFKELLNTPKNMYNKLFAPPQVDEDRPL